MLSNQSPGGGGEDGVVEYGIIEDFYRFGIKDVEDIKQGSKGKETVKTDAEIALDVFVEDAAAALTSFKDQMLAHSVQCALETDSTLLQEWAQVERREREDHNIALALSKGSPSFAGYPSSASSASTPSSSSVNMRRFSSSFEQSSTGPQATASLSRAIASSSRLSTSPSSLGSPHVDKEKHECIVCMDTIIGIAIKVPCGHFYDKNCLVELFTATMSDESLFPPRCCKQEIPVDRVSAYLRFDVRRLFDQKALEFSTQIRLYCSNKTCSRFLGPRADSASNVNCPACSASTCALCSDPGHAKSVPCKDDDASQVVLALGREQGWQRCPGCRQLVELNIGCYHMTCRCRAQFCYLCAALWKNCSCPQWDEQRLVAAAEQRVHRMPVAERPNENLIDAVQRVARNLRVNHECAHTRFAYRRGGGRCETCNHHLPTFLMASVASNRLLTGDLLMISSEMYRVSDPAVPSLPDEQNLTTTHLERDAYAGQTFSC